MLLVSSLTPPVLGELFVHHPLDTMVTWYRQTGNDWNALKTSPDTQGQISLHTMKQEYR